MNIETMKRGSNPTTTYEYDEIGQLTSESRTGYSASYTYDDNGNRASKTLNGGTALLYNHDEGDKLTSITQGGSTVRSFTYEKFGRMLTSTENSVTTTFAYDHESRLTSVTKSGMTTNTFAYNGFDTRYSKTDSGGTTTYKRNGSGVTSPVLTSSISGGATTTHTPGISERTSGTTTFSYSGLKNNELQSTGSSQAPAVTKEYDAFGNQVASSGTWSGAFQYGGPYGYQTDHDTNLKLLGHRYYDPTIGRFLTRDPAKDGRNWFAYSNNNPISLVDPSGLGPTVRQLINKYFGSDCGSEYGSDPELRQQIHRELGDRKLDGNPDLTEEEVVDAIKDITGWEPIAEPKGKPEATEFTENLGAPNPVGSKLRGKGEGESSNGGPDWDGNPAFDWVLLGKTIIVAGAIVISARRGGGGVREAWKWGKEWATQP